MNKNTVVSFQDREQIADPLNALLRTGARKLIEQAIEAELQELLSHYAGQQTDSGHAAVVRNGYLPERAIQTGIGPVTVKIPKVRSRTGEPITFRSALVPPYIRKSRSLRKLPRQVDSSKVEILAFSRASMGVIPPRLS